MYLCIRRTPDFQFFSAAKKCALYTEIYGTLRVLNEWQVKYFKKLYVTKVLPILIGLLGLMMQCKVHYA